MGQAYWRMYGLLICAKQWFESTSLLVRVRHLQDVALQTKTWWLHIALLALLVSWPSDLLLHSLFLVVNCTSASLIRLLLPIRLHYWRRKNSRRWSIASAVIGCLHYFVVNWLLLLGVILEAVAAAIAEIFLSVFFVSAAATWSVLLFKGETRLNHFPCRFIHLWTWWMTFLCAPVW